MCNNVNERQWAQALEAHGQDMRAAQRACGAGECCGTCVPELIERLHPAVLDFGLDLMPA